MRNLKVLAWALGLLICWGCRLGSQDVPNRLQTPYPPLNERLASMVTADSLAISAQEAHALPRAVYLDAREREEYAVSHLPGAVHLGFDDPDYGGLAGMAKDTPLVVYCTVGYRSERVAAGLRERGFTQVYNLYGSLYAWKLAGFPVVSAGGPTERIHTYNRKWGTYFPDSLAIKVY
ncbi:rhodanese-related sulfurtransferase [Lewinella aquimaris]|uniref:Rhodanese-related sulfurtransferase n=1 Tax=Neolewinella aquimaris TaxID=1835722 RepID=A0A840E0N0_9BACT|nr:rhodanese-like domain-containing protein [Neolewinella aquimaris]MBB4078781.1 rhodanese-related sulfurtransferase [Neolewinella aquimaris]